MPRTTIDGTDAVLDDAAFPPRPLSPGGTVEPRSTETYWKAATLAEAEALREALGRRYARSIGQPWPIPATQVGGGRHVSPDEAKTYWFEDFEVTKSGEYVFVRHQEMVGWRGDDETTDGTKPPEDGVVRIESR